MDHFRVLPANRVGALFATGANEELVHIDARAVARAWTDTHHGSHTPRLLASAPKLPLQRDESLAVFLVEVDNTRRAHEFVEGVRRRSRLTDRHGRHGLPALEEPLPWLAAGGLGTGGALNRRHNSPWSRLGEAELVKARKLDTLSQNGYGVM
jgi:hypothetical protein